MERGLGDGEGVGGWRGGRGMERGLGDGEGVGGDGEDRNGW